MKLRYVATALVAGVTLAGYAAPNVIGQGNNPSPKTAAAEPAQLSGGANDILKLARAKVSDDVILAFVKNSDRRYDLSAGEIIHLREAGVTDRVLAAMITHQPESPVANPPVAASPTPAPIAAAPQYTEPFASTAAAEIAPSSVYVLPGNTTYYYSDSWPYYSYWWWYNPWPYYWSSWWYYPYYSCGWWYSGDCHDNDWNDCNNGNDNWASNDGKQSGRNPAGGSDTSGRMPPTRSASLREGNQSGTLTAANSRPSAGMTRTAAGPGRMDAARLSSASNARTVSDRATLSARSQSAGAIQPNRAVASRNNPNQTAISPTAGSQSAGTTRTWINGANTRTVAARPVQNQAGTQLASVPGARTTSTWSGNAGQTPASRPVGNQGAVAVAPASRVTAGTTTWTRVGSQPANRSVANRPVNYQRSGSSYSSPRASTGTRSYSRPSYSAPSRSMGSSSAFRSSGGMSGGGTARPSMSGGFRGGGGGGRR